MTTKLIAPRPGEGVEELVISAWLKKEGDTVEEMEPIVEVETDKVVTEIPSPEAGVLLKINVPQGQSVKVGEVMALIGKPGDSVEMNSTAAPTKISEPKDADPILETQLIEPTSSTPDLSLSPLVRRMIQENNLDVSLIKGTGANGRITKNDVEAFLAAPTIPNVDQPQVIIKTEPPKISIPSLQMGDQLIPHTNTRKQIAERMVLSMHTSPHVLTVMEADMTRVLKHREDNKANFEARGINLTLTAYFIAAIAEALKLNPKVNASWSDEGLYVHRDLNIGMAVALGEGGLIVPVLKQTQNLSLQGIAQSVNDLAGRARAKKLATDEVKDGTFTLTNHGVGGSLFASPIINQPQLGILGTGKMEKRVVVLSTDQGDTIAIRPMVYLSFVFDHRALDGESADKFLSDVKQVLENWN